MLYWYLVMDGEAALSGPDADWDGIESILAYCGGAAEAVAVADAYDRGTLQPDNVTAGGRTVAAVRRCGHSACSQHWIDTGLADCVKDHDLACDLDRYCGCRS